MTENEQLAAGTGQDSPTKEPVEAHKASKGTYECPVGDHGSTLHPDQAPSPKTPFTKKG